MSGTQNVYEYHVNADNEIIRVNEAWDAFAQYNEGAHLHSSQITGKPLLESIPDACVRDLYERLLGAVRRCGHTARIPFRCDSPDQRRFMSLELRPEAEGCVRLSGRLLRREARAPVALLRPDLQRSNKQASLCAICLRMYAADGTWQEIEDAIEDPLDARPGRLPAICWSVCPECIALAEHQMQP